MGFQAQVAMRNPLAANVAVGSIAPDVIAWACRRRPKADVECGRSVGLGMAQERAGVGTTPRSSATSAVACA